MKHLFFVIATFGLFASVLDFMFGQIAWGALLVVLSCINYYNFFTWDKKMSALKARREQLLKQYESEKSEQQRKIDELYGK